MKNVLIVLALLFCAAGFLYADATTTGVCPTTNLGNGVTCHKYFEYMSTTASQTTVSGSFAPTSGYGVYMTAYACKYGAGCPSSGTLASLTVSDNINNPETCFVNSPNSPFETNTNSGANVFWQYQWYCPSIPSGVTTITVTANNTSGYITVEAFDFSGHCSSGQCWDTTDAVNIQTSASVTTGTVSTSGVLHYTNELVVAFFTNNNNESAAPGGSYITVHENNGNQLEALGVSNTNQQTATDAWTGNDGYWANIGTLKTAISSGTGPPANQLPRIAEVRRERMTIGVEGLL